MKKYSEIRKQLQTGDVIAFGGKGFVSEIIKRFTKSNISHVGVVLYINDGLVMVIESTSLDDGDACVKINRLSDHVRDYKGDMWILRLSEESDLKFHVGKFTRFMLAQVGKPYDAPQAIMSALDHIPDTKEDLSKLFCSELIAAGFEECGLIGETNASEITPIDLCTMTLYREPIQIKGKKKGISR